ncbi:DUF2188 domain-containing protein [Sphingomonas faeni]|uniref:DUF2188 domain-containing protein n=1 Tax=Sphingomonas faeni TaxID=185950 RepID=UPI0033650547
MPDERNIWCVTSKGGWAVKREGFSTPLRVYNSRDEAWRAAKQLATQGHGHAFLQELDGKIRDQA